MTWRGTVRGALDGVQVHPTTAGGGLLVWVGVGGSPESVLRAARHDLPMMPAVIGGNPVRFRPFADLFRRAQADHAALPLGVHSGGGSLYVGSPRTVADKIAGTVRILGASVSTSSTAPEPCRTPP